MVGSKAPDVFLRSPKANMSTDSPVQFMWGVFCRRALNDKATGLNSLIDLLYSIEADVTVAPQIEGKGDVTLNFGDLTIFASFKRTKPGAEDLNAEIDTTIASHSLNMQPIVQLSISQGLSVSTSVISIPGFSITLSQETNVFEDNIKVIYAYADEELGSIALPIRVSIKLPGAN
jgi:hypothetical protein